jgi:signal transduction histidine kinase
MLLFSKDFIFSGRCAPLIITAGLVLGAVALWLVQREQHHRLATTQAWSEATATVMAEVAERSLESITLSLDEAADHIETTWESGLAPGPWLEGRFSAIAAVLPHVGAVSLTDNRGRVAASWANNAGGPPGDLSDRDYIRVWLDGSTGDFYVSELLWPHAVVEQRLFAVSRPIRTPEGYLIGVLSAMVDIEYLRDLFRQPLKHPEDEIALVSEAGQVLVAAGTGLEPGQYLPADIMDVALHGHTGRREDPHRHWSRLAPNRGPMIVVGSRLDTFGLLVLAASPGPAASAVMAWPVAAWLALWAAAAAFVVLNARHRSRQTAARQVIQQHTAALEISTRDLELASRRAEKARCEAVAANEAKSRFLSTMSHELRTPLNAILGFSEMIRDRPFGDRAIDRYAGYAADIHASGQHLLALIGDILDLAKIDSGRLELTDAAVDLDDLLASAAAVIRPRCEAHSIGLAVAIAPPLAGIRADPRALTQIVSNLLGITARGMDTSGSIGISAGPRDDGDIAITITTTGVDIPKTRLKRLFRPFDHAEQLYIRKDDDVGFGLVLAKRLTELHGGRLQVDSLPAPGTSITVILPAARAIYSGQRPAAPVRTSGAAGIDTPGSAAA